MNVQRIQPNLQPQNFKAGVYKFKSKDIPSVLNAVITDIYESNIKSELLKIDDSVLFVVPGADNNRLMQAVLDSNIHCDYKYIPEKN